MTLHSYAAADLGSEIVRTYEEQPVTPEVAALRFEVEKPVQQGNELIFTGHLINAAAKPVSFIAALGPFGVGLVYENGLDWKPPWPGFPPPVPAPPPPVRITVPAAADVVYTWRYDLRTIAYEGSPEVRFHWYFSFLSRPGLSGEIAVRLPPATEENRPLPPSDATLRTP